jgi:hypothetical protein
VLLQASRVQTSACCSGGERGARAAHLQTKLEAYVAYSKKHPEPIPEPTPEPAPKPVPFAGAPFHLDGKSITAAQACILGEVVNFTRQSRQRSGLSKEDWYFWAAATRAGKIPYEVTGAVPRT